MLRVLYTSADKDSEKAKVLLKKAHVEFQEVFIHDPARENKIVPQLLTSEGFFPTLALIEWYTRIYGNGANSKKVVSMNP